MSSDTEDTGSSETDRFELYQEATTDTSAEQLTGWAESDRRTYQLAPGGFTGDTEVMTTAGPVRIRRLTTDHLVYALDPTTNLCQPKRVRAIERLPYEGEIISIQTRRAALRVAPEHRIPFQTKAISDTRFERAGDLSQRSTYRFINDWQHLPGRRLESVDITDLLDPDEYEMCVWTERHGHTVRAALPEGCEPIRYGGAAGYYFDSVTFKRHQQALEAIADEVTIHAGPNHHRRPYRFGGDDLIQFIGWFVTEGSVYWSKSSDTAQVKIAQENSTHRPAIRALLSRMGLLQTVKDRSFEFSSLVFGRLLERLCGTGSKHKRLPSFVWDLDAAQQQLLLETLLNGDGNERHTYYTASERLATDVSRLCVCLGVKPQFGHHAGTWRLYVRAVNDGFKPSQNVSREHGETDLYRLTIADYSVILAGRNAKFQWVGVSAVG